MMVHPEIVDGAPPEERFSMKFTNFPGFPQLISYYLVKPELILIKGIDDGDLFVSIVSLR